MTTNPDNPFNLPRFVFLNGPKGSGKTTLAGLLCAEDHELLLVSHIDPVRMMLMSVFYPDDLMAGTGPDLTSDIKTLEVPVPYGPEHPEANSGMVLSHREWLIQCQWWLRQLHGDNILAILADRTIQRNEYFYQRFVFDGTREPEDINYFVSKYGSDQCVIFQLYRNNTSWANDIGQYHFPLGVRNVILMNNNTPGEMLNDIRKSLSVSPTASEDFLKDQDSASPLNSL